MDIARQTLDLDRDQWLQVKAAIAPALQLPGPERPGAVMRALGDDPELCMHAVAMLRYYDTATRRFDNPTSDTLAHGSEDAPAPFAPIAAGTVVGSYRVVRRLGAGGMGVVYLAEDQRLGRHVALKFLAHDMKATVADSKARLLAESRSAAILNHPGIVTLHDVLDVGHELVTVMEYVEGRPLGELIASGPLALGYALRLTCQLADALAYAHGRGVAHCDLKPANIHVLPNGSPKILDFGLARALAGTGNVSEPRTGPLFGTPGYLAPEQLLGREPTAASDVYALGVIFYQLLTGTPPFEFGDNTRLLFDTITRDATAPSALVPGIPVPVDELALRCLHKDPRQRLQPHELNRALNAVLAQLEPPPAVPGAPRSDSGSGPVVAPGVFERLREPLTLWATRIGSVTVLAALSGLVTSWTFNTVVERPMAFDPDPFVRQFVTGVQSLVFPALTASVTLGLLSALQAVGLFLFVRFNRGALQEKLDHLFRTQRDVLFPALAQVVVFVGLVSLAIMIAMFGDLLDTLTARLGSAGPGVLMALHPANRWHQLMYRVSVPVLLAVLFIAWRGVSVSASRYGGRVPGGVRAAAFSLMVLLVVLVQAPYKLTVRPALPVVTVDEQRCYLLGENGSDARVYCPGLQEPRVRTVSRPAVRINGCGFDENIFLGVSGRACQ